jgi:hypothetical protein
MGDGIIKGIPNFFSSTMFGQTNMIITTSQFLVVAASVSIVLRVFSRRRTKSRFMWDDVCAFVALVFLAANTMIFVQFYYIGVTNFSRNGRNDPVAEAARRANIVIGLKLSLVFEVLYLIRSAPLPTLPIHPLTSHSIFLVKFSMLFLYERFARQTRGITLYLRITQAVCGSTFIICILALFLSCRPIHNFWNLSQTDSRCTKRALLAFTSGISNIITNTLVLAVPVPLLLRATLTKQQKIGLCILYFFGAMVILASALRFVTQLLNVSMPQAMGWSQMEVSLALLLACAPMGIKILLLPLVEPKVEIERIVKEKKGLVTPPDTPAFVKQLMSERNALVGRNGGTPRPSMDGGRLRVVRDEVNGQSVWEVRPMSLVHAV